MTICLRRTTEADLDFVLDAEQNSENREFVSAWTREQHQAACSSEDLRHLVIENLEGKRVGYIILAGLTDPNKSVEFRRIVVTEKNRGYGKKALREIKNFAFEELKAHRLWLDVKEHNTRARHVYKAEGFRAEGVLRECLKTESGYESLVVMSILDDEYENESDIEKPKLRTAVPEDSEKIASVLAAAFSEHESAYTAKAYAATVPSVEEIRKRFGEGKNWVAVCKDQIIGTVSVVPKKDSLYIRSMAIMPEVRGKQIGEQLLKEIENYAVARNYEKLVLNTTPFLKRAIQLYEKFDFIYKGTDDLHGTPLLTMEKSLKAETSKGL